MAQSSDTVLLTIRGFDAPGITSTLTKIIADDPYAEIIDIEQTVVHKQLLLSMLLHFAKGEQEKSSVKKELLFAAHQLGVKIEFENFDKSFLQTPTELREYAITCLGKNVSAIPLSRIAAVLAQQNVNIQKIAKLTEQSLSCVELLVQLPKRLNEKTFSEKLLLLARELDIDIAVQPANLFRRAKRMIVMDMDSTLVAHEAIDELAREHGVFEQVQAITARAMQGKMNFCESLKQRVALLKGLPLSNVEKVVQQVKLNPGAERLIAVLKHLGFKIGIVSGGFAEFAHFFQAKLKLDFAFSNQLEIKQGKLTGKLSGKIIDAQGKAHILIETAKHFGISLNQTIAIGDGANDVPMLISAGMGVAFHAKEIVRQSAKASIGEHAGLDSLLYLLGISEKELKGVL